MSKLLRSLLLTLSLTTGMITLIIGGMLITQRTTSAYDSLTPAQPLIDPFLSGQTKPPKVFGPAKPINVTLSSIQATKVTSSPTPVDLQANPTPEWMTYDGLDLSDQSMKVTINLACENRSISLPGVNLLTWYPGIFEEGKFDVAANTSIVWEHLGYYGLWMHSGQDWLGKNLTAYNLHDYLEREASGNLRTPAELEQVLQDCLVGSVVRLQAGGKTSLSRLTAAVRVPNPEVAELSEHVMDLVPYLAEQYPDSGFEQLKTPGLLFYFCGRRLVGETNDPNSFYFAQARIIIAMEPIPADYFR